MEPHLSPRREIDEVALYGETDNYHAERRTAIIKKHPELRSLMQLADPSFKFVLIACMITHLIFAYAVRNEPIWVVVLAGLTIGILFACPISNSLHEIVHELGFERNPDANKIFGLLVNLPLLWPLYGAYHKSHRNHHTYLGTDLDIKYASVEETLEHDQNIFTRLHFLLMHPIHSANRWQSTANNKVTSLLLWNLASLGLFNTLILSFFGYKAFIYLLVAFWLNECVLIEGSKTFTDHWSDEDTSHTMIYYGPINWINFNIGHHREHHDFPNIAGRYLSIVKSMAPEFYSNADFIEGNYFGPIWNLLIANPNEGLMRYANKINAKKSLKDE